jgi:S1-C subfamily serine protease
VLDAGGLIMTNNHVVAGARLIQVTTVSDGKAYKGEVVGTDPAHDVAVVRVLGAPGLPVAHFGDSQALQVGQQVAAIGNAGGAGGRPSVGTGPITGLHRSIVATDEDGSNANQLFDLIEAMNGIRPGDSGGALVNTDGVVIGLNVAGGFNRVTGGPNGSGEAIPINEALRYAHQIVDRANGGPVPGPGN